MEGAVLYKGKCSCHEKISGGMITMTDVEVVGAEYMTIDVVGEGDTMTEGEEAAGTAMTMTNATDDDTKIDMMTEGAEVVIVTTTDEVVIDMTTATCGKEASCIWPVSHFC